MGFLVNTEIFEKNSILYTQGSIVESCVQKYKEKGTSVFAETLVPFLLFICSFERGKSDVRMKLSTFDCLSNYGKASIIKKANLNSLYMEGCQMDIIRAKEIVRTLADGVDPTTGEIFPEDSAYNSPDVIRALFAVLEVVESEMKKDPLRNAGKPWTEVEDDKLRDEFSAGLKLSAIAKEHGRSYGAIESRLDLLGLKKKSFWFFRKKKS